VLRDVGIKLSLESYLYYVIPFNISFTMAWPLDRVAGEKPGVRYHLFFSYE
jgi:hypothetical protein